MGDAPELPPDVLEPLLIGLDVKDLIRCKSVCKSWHSLISSSYFVNAHLKHSYNNDQNNNELGHRRIVMSIFCHPYKRREDVFSDNHFDYYDCHVVGSSNGLVCIYASRAELFVVNPLTQDAKRLQKPKVFVDCCYMGDNRSFCWGFGYDSSTDDYKVVIGSSVGDETCFQVLSLKLNVWSDLKLVKYSFISMVGILCNGELHWFMNDMNKKAVIVSFDLSKDEFREIPQPDHPRYNYTLDCRFGIIEECLCIFRWSRGCYNKWVLKNNNVEQFWELLTYDGEMKNDVAHFLKNLKVYNRVKKSYFHDDLKESRTGEYLDAPIFVQSLVSPIVNWRPKRKRQTKNSKTSGKLIKYNLSGPSGEF